MNEQQDSVGFFDQTIWSTIIKAKTGGEETKLAALGRLLTRYWQPILHHIQAGQHCTPEQAKDLTQEFIQQCIRLDFLKQVSPQHGRFRTFVKTCIKNFLRDQHVKAAAAKRGGGNVPISLDETDEDGNPLVDATAPNTSPETILDREWALSVLEGALEMLKHECKAARRGDLFEALKGHLGRASEAGTAAQIAVRLGMNEGTVHTAMSRMRKRLGELISEEVRQTVGTQEDWRQELKYLVELLGH
jgi:RNA polymerase sigma-70 factor (ECF subfamily)